MRLSKRFMMVALASIVGMGMGVYGTADASEKGGHHHWAYEGETGPSHWSHVSPEFAVCNEGKSQSPIDITAPQKENIADINFSYKPSALNLINNGHTVQANYDDGSTINVNGVDYKLLQFHFHTPSEHTVGGKSFGMELHLVHKNDKGELAVVGVLLEDGKDNQAYSAVLKDLPKKANEKKSGKAAFNADDLLPKTRTHYTYSGSLTTPPCTENVTWLVLKTPVQISKKQIKALEGIMKHNNRPVQPMHDRPLKEDM
ncbi:MAG: carbonic anhydrase family protein [Deltaproteobacteria bacterium]